MTTAFVKSQYDLAYDEGIEAHWWHRARNRMLLGELRRCLSSHSRVLDVGCGRGIAVRYLREHGIKCDGVEPATTTALRGVEDHVQYGMNAQDLPLEVRKTYDVLMLLDVIEHLPQPDDFMRDLIAAFPCASYVLVTVPARQELWTNYDEHFGHYRRYSLKMLQAWAEACELEVLHQAYFFHAAYLPGRLLAKIKKARPIRVEPPRGAMKSVHAWIAAAMLIDNFATPGWIPGTSAVVRLKVRQTARS